MYKKILSIVSVLFGIPFLVSAHVKWFAQPVKEVRSYELTDFPVIIAIIAVIVTIIIGYILEKKLKIPTWFRRVEEKWAPYVISISSIGFGLSFLIFSYNGFIFAPNLTANGPLALLLIIIQTLAGIMILAGYYERIGGFLLVILFILGIKEYGFMEMMDTFEMLGFSLFAMIVGRPKWRIIDTEIFKEYTHRIHSYGLPLLRIGTGLNLFILGFSEKIMSPSLTENFLSQYHWNFMHNIGFTWFTDYWFAFSAGVAEALFGLFLILGLVTRTTIIALAIFLLSTLIMLGPVELIGHLPHFSIAIVLLLFGAGSRLKMK
jgi:uncharacterized membrane protein YphA (DoxX/SURF4 family)